MTLREHQEAFANDTIKLFQYIRQNGYTFTYGETWRHAIMQQWYVDNGYSKTMKSNHRRRLAIDLNIFHYGSYITEKRGLQHIGDYWESLNELNRWGGNFKAFYDYSHFERNAPW